LPRPPDILLTNYDMFELILTRPEERQLVASARGLRFLVLDDLHTYRGRQEGSPEKLFASTLFGFAPPPASRRESVHRFLPASSRRQEFDDLPQRFWARISKKLKRLIAQPTVRKGEQISNLDFQHARELCQS
jgi:hypothetical protein